MSEELSHEEWMKIIQSIDSKTRKVHFEKFLEEKMSGEKLIQLLNYDQKTKQEILQDRNTFKWTCAYGDKVLLKELWSNKVVYDEFTAIQACIMNSRLDNLCFLEEMGFSLYLDTHLNQLLSRSLQNNYNMNIVLKYLKNLDKISLLEITIKKIKESDWSNIPEIYKKESIFFPFLEIYKKEDLHSMRSSIYQKAISFASKEIWELLYIKNYQEIKNFFQKTDINTISFPYDYFYNPKNVKDFCEVLAYLIEKKLIDSKKINIENIISIIRIDANLTNQLIEKQNISKMKCKKIITNLFIDFHRWNDILYILENKKLCEIYQKMKDKDKIDIFNKLYEIKSYSSVILEKEYTNIVNFLYNHFSLKEHINMLYDQNLQEMYHIENQKNKLEQALILEKNVTKKIKI